MSIFKVDIVVLALGALVAAAGYGIGMLLAFPGQRWQLLLVLAVIVSLAMGLVIRYINRSRGDERLIKMLAWSGMNAFLTAIALFALLAVMHDLGVLPRETIGIGEALTGGLVIMVALFAFWYFVNFNKGDVA